MVTTTLQRTETMTVYVDGEDLVYERSFDAPRDLVWRAFTDANLIPRWWGKHAPASFRRMHNKMFRARCRQALREGREPPPLRKDAGWHWW